MPLKLDRLNIGRFRSFFLPALLVVALGVTGVVTLHAYKASEKYRAAFEDLLAASVSWVTKSAQTSAEMALYSCVEYWLYPVMTPKGTGNVDGIRADQSCKEQKGHEFEIDLQNQRAVVARGASKDLVPYLLKSIPSNPEIIERVPNWHLGTLMTSVRGRPELISYAVEKRDGKEVRAIGLVAVGVLDYAMATAIEQLPLPTEFGTTGKLTDFFYLGTNHHETPPEIASSAVFMQDLALRPEFGGLAVRAGLLPAGLHKLAPDGMPRNRGFEFLSLFGLAAALVISSLLLLKREAELARTRANFVSGVSHELRTPLAQIRMFAEMLLLGRVRTEGDRRRSLEIIDTEARRLSQLVENVLQVARSENGHLHVNPTNMRLAPIIRECVESFSMLAQARSIQFRTELQDNLIAPIDSASLRQIVLNLLDNAAKYGPVGQRVVAGVAMFDNTARIWVDDEGAGVPARERERVFEPFYRIRDAQNTTGSGIGLSVVRELVALHGGEVWIEDAPDGGARVVVQFPGAYLSAEQATGDFAVA